MNRTDANSGTTKRIVVLPSVVHPDDLGDLVARLSFYLAPMRDWIVTIPTAVDNAPHLVSSPDDGGGFRVPEGMDPRIATLHLDLSTRIELVDAHDESAVRRVHDEADLVFVHDRQAMQTKPWSALRSASLGKRVYDVDRDQDRMEGSQFLQSVFANSPSRAVLAEDSVAKFENLVTELGHHSVAYLLATGPSIDRFSEFDFSDGLVIACNTTILDAELLKHTRPRIVTFADPIFHFGCSLYAAAFRDAVRKAAEDHDFHIVIPDKYYELYTYLEPSLASRVIGVPFSQREINLDLLSDFKLKVADNIATFTMLPLAATFATNIAFLGFDGRKPNETYFWRHSPRTQLNHLMENIKTVHPSFFTVEYHDYYASHCDNLARYIEHGEAKGKRFYTLHPSAIPALAVRERGHALQVNGLAEALAQDSPSFRVLTLNPDWVDDFGHYGSYDRRLAEAVKALDGELVSIANVSLGDRPVGLPVVGCFSGRTQGSLQPSRDDAFRFEDELAALLDAYADLDRSTPTVFAMYTSSPWQLSAFIRLKARFSDRPWAFAANLFHMHEELLRADFDPGSDRPIEAKAVQITRELRDRMSISIHADSSRLERAIHRYSAEWPHPWPMFSTSLSLEDAVATGRPESGTGRLTVYCPANAQLAKGYDLLLALLEATTRTDQHTWTLMVRSVVRPNTAPRLRAVAQQLQERTDALPGILTDAQYVEAFRQADVILIPYRLLPFASRTSAVLSDAILLGKPVVATRESWAGEHVERLGIGATFHDGDVNGMLIAIRLVCQHIDHYRKVAEVARADWAEQHSAIRLAEVLQSRAGDAQSVTVDDDLSATIARVTRTVDEMQSDRGRARSSRSTDGERISRSRQSTMLSLLQTARRGERTRRAARRLYRLSPRALRTRVDDLVRSNPG